MIYKGHEIKTGPAGHSYHFAIDGVVDQTPYHNAVSARAAAKAQIDAL